MQHSPYHNPIETRGEAFGPCVPYQICNKQTVGHQVRGWGGCSKTKEFGRKIDARVTATWGEQLSHPGVAAAEIEHSGTRLHRVEQTEKTWLCLAPRSAECVGETAIKRPVECEQFGNGIGVQSFYPMSCSLRQSIAGWHDGN